MESLKIFAREEMLLEHTQSSVNSLTHIPRYEALMGKLVFSPEAARATNVDVMFGFDCPASGFRCPVPDLTYSSEMR